MKIVVFSPHGDDELYAAGGSILKWLDQGHEVHLIYVTDNRAWLEWGIKKDDLNEELARTYMNLTGDEMAEVCLEESREVANALEIPEGRVHFFKFHDQGANKRIQEGIERAKKIISDADQIVMPSDHNGHVDHQATHDIAKRAAKDLKLDIQYYVYALYDVLKVPREKQEKIKVVKYRDEKYEIMGLYKTQLCLNTMRLGRENFKRKRYERFGVFTLQDMNKHENF